MLRPRSIMVGLEALARVLLCISLLISNPSLRTEMIGYRNSKNTDELRRQ